MERQATEELDHILPKAATAGVEVIRLVATGSPYRQIIEVVAAQQADLIVMATAGRTGFSRLVMGSIAERVVRTATCTVLTIRPRE